MRRITWAAACVALVALCQSIVAGAPAAGDPERAIVFAVDEKGTAIEGATVEMYREPSGPLASYEERARCDDLPAPYESAVADNKGMTEFRVPPGASWTVVARAPGRARVARPRLGLDGSKARQVALSLPPARTLTGRVLDADGRPVPRAFVVARKFIPMIGYCATCEPPQFSSALWQHAVADAEGRFVLDGLAPGTTEIVAGARGTPGEYVLTADVPALTDVDLTLGGTATIAGRATDDATGAPIAGVVVAARSGMTARISVTDAGGRYEIAGLAAGAELEMGVVPAPGWTRFRGGFGPSSDDSLRPGQTLRVDCALRRGAVVTGRALRDGEPVANAEITVVTLPVELDGWVPGFASGRADAEGRFRIADVFPGQLAVCATAPEDDDSKAYDAFYKWVVSNAAGRARFAFAAAPGATVERDVVVGPPAPRAPEKPSVEEMAQEIFKDATTIVVRGRVTSDDGVAPVDVRLSAESGDADPDRAMRVAGPSAADGTYSREVPLFGDERTLTVCATDTAHDPFVRTVPVPDGAREVTLDVTLHARPVVKGRIHSGDQPVAGALVRADGVVVARSGADGAFAARLSAGKVRVHVSARGFVARSLGEVEVQAGADLDVALEPALSLAGLVVDAKGAPVAGALVTPRSDDRAARGAVTGADGRFHLDGLSAGQWRLRVESSAGTEQGLATQTTEPFAAGARDVCVVVAPGLRIAGRVVGSRKEALRNADVVCRPGPGGDEKAEARSDSDGRFEFDGLVPGAYVVTVTPTESTHMASATRDVKAGTTDAVVDLTDAPTISGVLVDEKGAPIAGEEIEAVCTDEDAEPSPQWRRDPTGTTAADGTFRILVPSGTKFRLSIGKFAKLRDHAVLTGQVDVTRGAPDVRLVANTSLGLHCVVVDPEGKPIAGAEALIRLRGNEQTLSSDANGRFGVAGVAKIDAAIRVRAKGHAPVQLYKVATGGPEVRIVLRPALTITGRIVDAAGRPCARYAVRAFSPAFPGADLWRATVDAAGRFEIGDLDAGDWYLEAFVAKGEELTERTSLGQQKAGARDVELRLPE